MQFNGQLKIIWSNYHRYLFILFISAKGPVVEIQMEVLLLEHHHQKKVADILLRVEMRVSSLFTNLYAPVQLPCGHLFCYMCIKGVFLNQNSGCPMCRGVIPITVLTNPVLKEDPDQLSKGVKLANGPEWMVAIRRKDYERAGKAFRNNQQTCQLVLAGHIYVVDFTQMIQYRLTDVNAVRRIKHGTNQPVKGVAGILMTGNGPNGGNNGIPAPQPPPNTGPVTRARTRLGNPGNVPGNT
ncbi:hypothetical protein Ocin01_19787 [Orchesella cincta]|uniref:E3 ubiquitin-protein ligase n=1 Tax=Orchesella cincta TaxID=48709 RepID=A0A1D2M1R1_ORCCI|nr:hypothetical protein Ocin01_19787 [Orchesella cincta]